MKKNILLIFCLLFISCSSTPKQYQSKVPLFTSPIFPSFSPVSAIKDGIQIKLAEGSGKSKILMNIKATEGQSNTMASTITDWEWDINVENNLIHSNHIFNSIIYSSNEKETMRMKFDCIHEINGEEVKMDVSLENADNFTDEELSNLKKEMSSYINKLFLMIGKSVKTGDVLNNFPIPIPGVSELNIPHKFEEVVKGLGKYNGKSVVVTEVILDFRMHRPGEAIELVGKGYKLYDPDTFIQLYGEVVLYLNIDTVDKKLLLKTDNSYTTADMEIRNIIGADNIIEKRVIIDE